MIDDVSQFGFSVEPHVFKAFPTYLVGCIVAVGVKNAESSSAIERLLQEAESNARERFTGIDVKSVPAIAAWRTAFATCGWAPSKYPSSVEALLKRVVRGDALPRINPVVDLVNTAVLLHTVPIGAHDLALVSTDGLSVRPATSIDTFEPMGEPSVEVLEAGEIVYVSGSSVRTRRWVWRQAKSALVTPATKNLFIPIDGFHPVTSTNVENALTFLMSSLIEHLGATIHTGCVTAAEPTFSIHP